VYADDETIGENIAPTLGTASQIKGSTRPASLAIDGNTTTYSQVPRVANPWWKVDLSSPVYVKRIVIYNQDCSDLCQKWLSQTDVYLKNGSEVVAQKKIGDSKGKLTFTFNFEGELNRGILITSLMLERITGSEKVFYKVAEVEIYESTYKYVPEPTKSPVPSIAPSAITTAPSFVLGENIAPQGIASQIDGGGQYNASLAIDGDRNTRAHSLKRDNPWWKVDLATPSYISRIVVYNGICTDNPNCPKWLSQTDVYVSYRNDIVATKQIQYSNGKDSFIFDFGSRGILATSVMLQKQALDTYSRVHEVNI